MTYLVLAVGLVLLIVGGDVLVRGAVTLAARAGVSPLLVGLTVVGFGTSTPELVTSLDAALSGSPGIAIGNVVGSNIANILLILGIAAVIAPVAVDRVAFRRDGAALFLASAAAAGLVLAGTVTRLAGIALFAGLVVYIVAAYRLERRGDVDVEENGTAERSTRLVGPALLALVGIAITIAGARLLVSAATTLALDWGVSETLVGLTVVAVGTSLPELVTAVVAALRRQGDIAFGNVVGSNIFNTLGILGVTGMVKPVPVPPEIAGLDIWVMLAATAALAVAAVTRWRVSRREGAALVAAYLAYTSWLALGA